MDENDNKRLGEALISLGEGNMKSLEEITVLMEKLLRAIANSYYPSKADVDDVVEDCYFILHKIAKDFKRNDNAKGWILRVFKNQLISRKRKELRQNEALIEYARTQAVSKIDEAYIDRYLFMKEIQDYITEEEWELFEYKEWGGYTIREIAELMHKSKGSVEYQLKKIEEKINSIRSKTEE